MARRLLVLAAAAAVIAGCGGGEPRDRAAQAPTRTPILTGVGISGTGRLVDIGGRKLYLECVGSGSPTVLLEAGFGSPSKAWVDVQEALGRTSRTCAYDRAGTGTSVGTPGVHDAADEIRDLEKLLAAARVEPPYVLVGHSYGGLLVRLFAQAHPDDTAGVVLVDAMGRDQTRRELAAWPPSVASQIRRDIAEPVVENVDLRAGERAAARIRSLGDAPLAVVTAGRHEAELRDLPRGLRTRLDRLWTTMQDELAALSPDRLHVVALRSGHFVQRLDGQPGVVVRAVRTVVDAAREGKPLPACSSVFDGRGVRCRT
jgi:pimeloyl-ACP methyl ester carboxylesterase